MGKYIFLLIFSTIISLSFFYSYFRLLKKLDISKKPKQYLKFFFILVYISFISYILSRIFNLVSDEIVIILSISIAIIFILFSMTLFYELSSIPIKLSRRAFLKKVFDITIILIIFTYTLKALSSFLKYPNVVKRKIKIKNLKNKLNIVQISDLHIGILIKEDFIRDVIIKTNELKPDIVVLTGDILDDNSYKIEKTVKELAKLKTKFGVYFSLGNHEYYYDTNNLLKLLKEANVKPLINDSVIINNSINLIGLADIAGYKIGKYILDYDLAFSKIDKNLPNIVLSHQPKSIEYFDLSKTDLILSGHTHAGQIFPFSFLVLLVQPYLKGLHKISEKTQIYVSQGAAYSGTPIRFLADNHIDFIELYSK